MPTKPNHEDILNAFQSKRWSIANDTLYSLCQTYPSHDNIEATVAKLWIIGRTYNAQIERRKTSSEHKQQDRENGGIYHVVANALKHSNFDQHLNQLSNLQTVDEGNLIYILSAHEQFMRLMIPHLNQRNTSFASKYLHFHFPKLFFILDKIAEQSLKHYDIIYTDTDYAEFHDIRYRQFCNHNLALRNLIKITYGISMTPRQLDNLLLRVW
jgi:hypothetical protein